MVLANHAICTKGKKASQVLSRTCFATICMLNCLLITKISEIHELWSKITTGILMLKLNEFGRQHSINGSVWLKEGHLL
jgi:hypothetical protein